MNFKNKKVLIMGLGIIGKGLKDALFFHEQGAIVTVTDLKKAVELEKSVDVLKHYPDIKLHLGGHKESDFLDTDLIVRNPAIPANSKFLKLAQENNKKIVMDDSLAVTLTEAQVIGITGTRGKTTTATLIYEILKLADKDVYLSGNIRGTATLPLLDKLNKDSYLVLELSSWQLQGFRDEKISSKYSIITNIYPDHLNTYSSMEEYVDDKKCIYKFQNKNDFLFLNQDNLDQYHQAFKNDALAHIVYFSKSEVEGYQTNLIGEHNLANIAAARALALELGISEEIIKKAVSQFQPIEFRLQKIREIKGVSFVNDSASTSPMAGIKALHSFPEHDILLIAGGASKGLPIKEWAQEIANKAKKVALLEGSETLELKRLIEIDNQDVVIDIFNNLKDALMSLYDIAKEKDVILLSPGAASFGIFKNEFDRANQFNKIVQEL